MALFLDPESDRVAMFGLWEKVKLGNDIGLKSFITVVCSKIRGKKIEKFPPLPSHTTLIALSVYSYVHVVNCFTPFCIIYTILLAKRDSDSTIIYRLIIHLAVLA